MLHLVPQWQSAERHRKLKVMMQVGVFSVSYKSITIVLQGFK